MLLGIVSQVDTRPTATAIIANIRLTAVSPSQNHIAILRRLRIECPFVPAPAIISQSEFGSTANVGYDGMKKEIYSSILQLQLITPTRLRESANLS